MIKVYMWRDFQISRNDKMDSDAKNDAEAKLTKAIQKGRDKAKEVEEKNKRERERVKVREGLTIEVGD